LDRESAVADENVGAFAGLKLQAQARVLDVVGDAERQYIRRVEERELQRDSLISRHEPLGLAAEAERERVFVLGIEERAVHARADRDLDAALPRLIADVDEHVADADEIALLVVEHAAAR